MRKQTANDFKFIRILGEGSFSSVFLAVDADLTSEKLLALRDAATTNGEPQPTIESGDASQTSSTTTTTTTRASRTSNKARKYAIKVCQKSYITRNHKQAAIMREKEIMNILNQHPNQHFIRLYCTFQDTKHLFFVMTYAKNGELLNYMQKNPLSIECVQKYTLQLVSALEHLHRLDMVHRDLKPENILLDENFDLMITDFGSAQIDRQNPRLDQGKADRRNSFVGTAQYVSPEMLKSRHATNVSDLWALGVIIFQMVTNVMPFNAPNEYLIYQKIQSLDYAFPDDFDPNARDLVSSLIKLEPAERLGASDDLKNEGYSSIRRHSFILDTNINESKPDNNIQKTSDVAGTTSDPDLTDIDSIRPGYDEREQLRLMT